jgi:hypothetical protein
MDTTVQNDLVDNTHERMPPKLGKGEADRVATRDGRQGSNGYGLGVRVLDFHENSMANSLRRGKVWVKPATRTMSR